MALTLHRPLCFFDLETTGIDITNDRIVEIAILKRHPNEKVEEVRWLINPEQHIPEQASAVHGITDADVADAPTFKQLGHEIKRFMEHCDLAGYNSDRFDIPLLAEEFLRAEIDIDFKGVKTVDVQTIFHKMEQRTLSAALKFYCNQELEDAHTALADTKATHDVLLAQLERYDALEGNVADLSAFTTRKRFADFAGFIVFNKEDKECFSFGKHKGKTVVEVLETEPGYFGWLLNADFPRYTKKVLTQIRLQNFNK